MVDYVSMGRRMKMKRRSMHLSQAKVAAAVHISTSFYGNIERGMRIPSLDTLVEIANVLHVGADFLLFDSLLYAVPQHTKEEMKRLTQYLRDFIDQIDYSGAESGDEAIETEE